MNCLPFDRWRRLALPAILLTCHSLGSALGGTGAGNEFEHLINPEFDFHMAMPPDWMCDGCDESRIVQNNSETEHIWTIRAPEGTTWIDVRFITGFPASSKPELESEISRRHPGWTWHDIDRSDGAFVGYSNSPLLDQANNAVEYYLIKDRMVIRIEWQKDGTLPARSIQLDHIKMSIDRASAPPRITAVHTEASVPLQPGDTACWLVEVDDLRGAFDRDSLSSFVVKGAPRHFSLKSIQWVGAKSWFRVCHAVTTAFPADGLQITELNLTGGNQYIYCKPVRQQEQTLQCGTSTEVSEDSGYQVTPRTVPVLNPSPDLSGPAVTTLAFDADNLTLKLHADDPAGLFMASIETRTGSVTVYPDQLRTGAAIDLGQVTSPGWNLVTRVVIYDGNGLPTVLQEPDSGIMGRSGSSPTYEKIDWNGQRSDSGIPVISWLQARRAN